MRKGGGGIWGSLLLPNMATQDIEQRRSSTVYDELRGGEGRRRGGYKGGGGAGGKQQEVTRRGVRQRRTSNCALHA